VGKIYPQKRNGQVVGYSVYVGVSPDGRRERRFVTKLESAENFVRVQTTDPRPVAELFNRKAELLYALEQLRSVRVTLPEVVTFYVCHHHASFHGSLAKTAGFAGPVVESGNVGPSD
jgi:hypothetical protein